MLFDLLAKISILTDKSELLQNNVSPSHKKDLPEINSGRSLKIH